MFALRRKLPIAVHTSFDISLMKDPRSFVNRGQADTVRLYISDVFGAAEETLYGIVLLWHQSA